MEQAADLFDGYEIRILLRPHTPDVCRTHPGVPLEAEFCDELVVPSGDDGLTGRVAAGVVVVPVIRAAFGVAARP
jgi:hypothetical protein